MRTFPQYRPAVDPAVSDLHPTLGDDLPGNGHAPFWEHLSETNDRAWLLTSRYVHHIRSRHLARRPTRTQAGVNRPEPDGPPTAAHPVGRNAHYLRQIR